MNIHEDTVKWHVKNLFAKLSAGTRKQVVSRATDLGILAPASSRRLTPEAGPLYKWGDVWPSSEIRILATKPADRGAARRGSSRPAR